MELAAGSRWRSVVCDTEVVVVRPPKIAVSLECGGLPMGPYAEARPTGLSLSDAHAGGSQMGKRFTHEASGLEVLCSKSGAGSLAVDGLALAIKDAKKLPSSD